MDFVPNIEQKLLKSKIPGDAAATSAQSAMSWLADMYLSLYRALAAPNLTGTKPQASFALQLKT